MRLFNFLRKPAVVIDNMDQPRHYDRRNAPRSEVTIVTNNTPYVALTEGQGDNINGCLNLLLNKYDDHQRMMREDPVYADKYVQAARLMLMMPQDQATYYVKNAVRHGGH